MKKEKIQVEEKVESWKEAIKVASKPLVANGSVENNYVESMIKGVEEMGPYIVIAPHIAFAHARPEDGVNKTDISLLVTSEPVSFSAVPEHQCSIIFAFAAEDDSSHLQLLSELSAFLSEEKNVEALNKAKNGEEIYQIIQNQGELT
jgi:mannitol/fructose-specific phosphotransferase system IIA component (Ntr-type)